MIDQKQFQKAREFVFRQGDLLTRKRFAYHFENGSKQSVVDALSCYQNGDGGFGNGLELDILCPESSGICTEMAFGYLLEIEATDNSLFDGGLNWVVTSTRENGDLPHPHETVVKKFPHGAWWETDSGRIMSIAGLLGKAALCHPSISRRASAVFEESNIPFPEELGVYSYPSALYLRYGDVEGRHRSYIPNLDAGFHKMLEKEAWHCPLFFCHGRWEHEGIPASLWCSEATKAISTLQDDGGVGIEQYTQLSWWRPVWTLDLLVTLKRKGFLSEEVW